MQTLIDSLNDSEVVMPPGQDRNKWRNAKYAELCALVCKDSFLLDGTDIGSSLANIAILEKRTDMNIDVDLLKKLVDGKSAYVADKALRVLLDYVLGTRPYEDDVYKEGFMGCLIGTAVGDSVGMAVEGHDRDVCLQYVQEVVQPMLISGYHRFGMQFGQYSDDTQLTREMYLSVLQGRGKMDPVVYGLRIAMLFQPGAYRIVGYGAQTAKAAEAIRNGIHWTESGGRTGQGNGGVMRSACVGTLLMKKEPGVVVETAKDMSSITHASPACLDGAKVIALAAYYALLTRRDKFCTGHFIGYLVKNAEVSDEFKGYLGLLKEWVKSRLAWQEVATKVADIGVNAGERRWGMGISVGVRQTALWALYCFMVFPDSYVDCISMAIAVGGDVDTTAATVGGIIGARVGHGAIPQIWRKQLRDMEDWKYKELVEMGEKTWEHVVNDRVKVDYDC